MLDPRRVPLTRQAFVGLMILVALSPAYAYVNGKKTDKVTAVRAEVVLPGYGYDRLVVKLPLGTEVDESLIGKAVDFTDFEARVYVMDGRVGYSATATAVTAAKA